MERTGSSRSCPNPIDFRCRARTTTAVGTTLRSTAARRAMAATSSEITLVVAVLLSLSVRYAVGWRLALTFSRRPCDLACPAVRTRQRRAGGRFVMRARRARSCGSRSASRERAERRSRPSPDDAAAGRGHQNPVTRSHWLPDVSGGLRLRGETRLAETLLRQVRDHENDVDSFAARDHRDDPHAVRVVLRIPLTPMSARLQFGGHPIVLRRQARTSLVGSGRVSVRLSTDSRSRMSVPTSIHALGRLLDRGCTGSQLVGRLLLTPWPPGPNAGSGKCRTPCWRRQSEYLTACG